MKTLNTLLASFIFALQLFAHEGHNKTPGSLTAPHGGKIKGTSQLYIELVSDSKGFKLYTYDHDLKTIPVKEVKFDGKVKFPKQKKVETIKFNNSESFFEAVVDAKGTHRYTVDLKVKYIGKTESISFNVEPQE
jgi:hypothetical protein